MKQTFQMVSIGYVKGHLNKKEISYNHVSIHVLLRLLFYLFIIISYTLLSSFYVVITKSVKHEP